jgi:hypothetical protein
MIRMMDGIRVGRCLDGESLDVQLGGPVHVYPCTKRWHQFLSFGNGKEAPKGSLHTTVPLHTRRRVAETGREQEAYMCLGVAGRGDTDEEDWLGTVAENYEGDEHEDYESGDEEAESDEEAETDLVDEIDVDSFGDETEDDSLPPLSDWEGEQLVATRCSNVGAVIEWILVPFVEEDVEEQEDESVDNGTAVADDEEEL